MPKNSKARYGILIVLLVSVIAIVSNVFAIQKYICWNDSGEFASGVTWLPEYATNVSYTRTNSFRIYEFDVSEDEFRKWAGQYQLTEISEPFYIERYNFDGNRGIGGSNSEFEISSEFNPETVAKISNGLKYRSWKENRGGVSVCYDRNIGRAFFHSRNR